MKFLSVCIALDGPGVFWPFLLFPKCHSKTTWSPHAVPDSQLTPDVFLGKTKLARSSEAGTLMVAEAEGEGEGVWLVGEGVVSGGRGDRKCNRLKTSHRDQ